MGHRIGEQPVQGSGGKSRGELPIDGSDDRKEPLEPVAAPSCPSPDQRAPRWTRSPGLVRPAVGSQRLPPFNDLQETKRWNNTPAEIFLHL